MCGVKLYAGRLAASLCKPQTHFWITEGPQDNQITIKRKRVHTESNKPAARRSHGDLTERCSSGLRDWVRRDCEIAGSKWAGSHSSRMRRLVLFGLRTQTSAARGMGYRDRDRDSRDRDRDGIGMG